MADNADMVVAFWDGESSGTEHMIQTAKQKGLKLKIVRTDPFGKSIQQKQISRMEPEEIKSLTIPSKKQAKVTVLKNTEGLNEEEIDLISDAWLYEETGGAAGDYQPLKKYVENNLPFSQGLGTQAFIQDLINEFSAVPNIRGKLAKALRRKTKVKPVGNIPYRDFSQGSLVKSLQNKFGDPSMKIEKLRDGEPEEIYLEFGKKNIKPDIRGRRYSKDSRLPAQQYRPSQTLTDSMGQKWENTPANRESIRIENDNASRIAAYFQDWDNKRHEEHIRNMSNQEFLDGYGLEAKREEVIQKAYKRNQRKPKHTSAKVIKDFNESAFPLQDFIDAKVIENDILNARNKQKPLTMDEWHKWSQSRFGLNSGGLLNRLKRKVV